MAKINVFLAVAVVVFGVALAITEEEKNAIKEVIEPISMKCRSDFAITLEELLAAKKAKDVNALNPCYYACFFKKVGFITEDGRFDPDVTLEKNKKYIKGEEDVKALTAINKACASVNEESVTDGEKGCDRAKLLISCFIKEKASFSPLITE